LVASQSTLTMSQYTSLTDVTETETYCTSSALMSTRGLCNANISVSYQTHFTAVVVRGWCWFQMLR